ncbi:MAG: hypothetical protein LBJ00_00080 [Planctomycetaceae bacterium]|nr:hypothetical protein [Planctomycetaceae bacterium]
MFKDEAYRLTGYGIGSGKTLHNWAIIMITSTFSFWANSFICPCCPSTNDLFFIG